MAKKAMLHVEGASPASIPVMFNPSEYTRGMTSVLTGEGSNLQFTRVNPDDFSLELIFDAYEEKGDKRDVRKKTDPIIALIMPTVEGSHAKEPPVVRFVWGHFNFSGVVSKVEQKFTLFLNDGVPVRSHLNLTLKAYITPSKDLALTGNEACRKLWLVRGGERLDQIAYRAGRGARGWKQIARANGVRDPLRFSENYVGRELVIPDV